jgi:hypothetical protein
MARPKKPRGWTEPWREWKTRIHESMQEHLGFRPGLAVLEQHLIRSAAEQRCVDCGAPGTVPQDRTPHSLVKSVQRYWFCQSCSDYWAAKTPPKSWSRQRAGGARAASRTGDR